MGTLAIKQLLENSELKGVELGLETATLEDQVIFRRRSKYIMKFTVILWFL